MASSTIQIWCVTLILVLGLHETVAPLAKAVMARGMKGAKSLMGAIMGLEKGKLDNGKPDKNAFVDPTDELDDQELDVIEDLAATLYRKLLTIEREMKKKYKNHLPPKVKMELAHAKKEALDKKKLIQQSRTDTHTQHRNYGNWVNEEDDERTRMMY